MRLRFPLSILLVSLGALAAPAFALDPGWQLAADKGCYNCHGDPPRSAVPSFKEITSRYARFGGKADAGFIRHEVEEVREMDILVHRELSPEEGEALIQWLVESAGRASAGKMQPSAK